MARAQLATETAASPAAPFDARTPDEIQAGSAPQVVQGLFYGVTVIVAGPNMGKSALALDALMCVSADVPFFGRKVRSGPCIYVGAEAPHSIVQRSRATAREKFAGRRVPLYIVRDAPRLGDESVGDFELARLVATVEAVSSLEGEPVRAIGLDTVAMVLAGSDENGDGMLRLVAAAQNLSQLTGASIVLLHHPSKADPQGLRGHSSLAAAADVIVNITQDPFTNTRTATVVKSRDAPAGGEIHFTLEPVTQPEPDQFGDPVTTVIVRAADTPPTRSIKAQGGNQQKALTALREWARTHEAASLIAIDELGALFKAHGLSRQRRPEVLDYLSRVGVLAPSIGGYRVSFEVLR
jgi:hypothetical protein